MYLQFAFLSVDVSKPIRDEVVSEPLKVENRGAWTMLAHKESYNERSPIKSDVSASSSLWLYARTMEQKKLQKEQMKDSQLADELAEQVSMV